MAVTLVPYLTFNGNCAEAMKYYQSILSGELTMQTFGESGYSDSPEVKDRIIHSQIENGAFTIFASDAMSEANFGDNISLSLIGSDTNTLTGYFNKLAEGGTIGMPLEKQFWGDVFGSLTDKYGVQWQVNIIPSA